MRLTANHGKARTQRPNAARTTLPGFVNKNRQQVIANTGRPSTSFTGQIIYRMKCEACQEVYGSNGCDVHARRCPQCQGGVKGEPIPEPEPMLFE